MARSPIVLGLVATMLVACGRLGGDRLGGDRTAPPPVSSGAPATPMISIVPSLRYVALGDSYTIGTSVALDARWPNQLVAALGSPASLDLVANLGVNGYTSRDVIDAELPQLDSLGPEFVTLLIGVNDVVQGVAADTYRANVAAILDDLVARLGADRALVVTTPDYTVTPAGADYGDPALQSAEIRKRNDILSSLAAARGITVIDIYDISRRAATDPSLVASDGLHPSGAQYALWVARMVPAVTGLLSQ